MVREVLDEPAVEVGEPNNCTSFLLVGAGQSATPATLIRSISTELWEIITPL